MADGRSGVQPDLTPAPPSWPPPPPPAGHLHHRPPPPPGPHRPPGRHPILILLAVWLIVLLALGAVIGHTTWNSSPSNPTTTPPTSSPGGKGTVAPGAPVNSAAIAATVSPGLVNINVTNSYQAIQGAGSGMVLTSKGEILTNNHVIQGATSISVVDVGNGQTYRATVVGYSRANDVAVVRLSGASGLQTTTFGDSSKVAVGDGVVAVGNAGGRGGMPSYAGGAVTATGQTITAQDQANGTSEQLQGLIETNAAIVAGDSGGALADARAQVIGMSTAGSEGYQIGDSGGRGYAVPSNEARAVAAQILAGRSSATVHVGPTAFLGVGVQAAAGRVSGATLVQTVPGGPADQAGLGPGDTITSIDGQPIDSPEALTQRLLATSPGQSITVGYVDSAGQSRTTTVRLGSGPPQ